MYVYNKIKVNKKLEGDSSVRIRIMFKYSLELVVFICGAAVMILEMVGSRMMAPYLGTSIIVWTSLIGIILGFLSLGYWLGGKLADIKPSYKIFSLVILLASLFVFLTIFIQGAVLSFIQTRSFNIYLGTVFSAVILFGLPSVLMGVVSPYAARLKIKSLDHSGEAVGSLYALSTLGSIIGTFAAGFVLIPFLGTIKILYFLSLGLLLASLLAYSGHLLKFKVAAAFLIFLLSFIPFSQFGDKVMADIDTKYSRVLLEKEEDKDTGEPILKLSTDPFGDQSAMFLDPDKKEELVFDYLKFYRLADHFVPNPERSLIIGGAAYSYPRDHLNRHPDSRLDVVEIDSGMTKIARDHFDLQESSNLNIHHRDARVFLNNSEQKYDTIFMDAFSSSLSIPYQLTTREAVTKIHDQLKEDGVVLVNIISSITGEKGKFLRAEYRTYSSVFPQVYLFPVTHKDRGDIFQNIVMVALKSDKKPEFESENKELDGYLDHLWEKDIPRDIPVLTDDHAPVDYYILKRFEHGI